MQSIEMGSDSFPNWNSDPILANLQAKTETDFFYTSRVHETNLTPFDFFGLMLCPNSNTQKTSYSIARMSSQWGWNTIT